MIVGTAGHVDHGKTSLVRILTGVDTDRLKEEKARKISIDLGFAYLASDDDPVIGFVDVPGHERFIHNMLSGATGIDFVLLVVAADDGVMPQTIEHLSIIDLLGIDEGVVALTKSDLVDKSRLDEVSEDIRRHLDTTILRHIEIIPVSSASGDGIDLLKKNLSRQNRARESQKAGRRDCPGLFRLSVDRSFTLRGVGVVVTGTVVSGSVKIGDQVVVSPGGHQARVRSLRAQDREAQVGRVGDRCALNLTGEKIVKEAISRGDVILDAAAHAPSNRVDVRLRSLSGMRQPIVQQWMPVRLHYGASEIGARILPLDLDRVLPGHECLAQLVTDRLIAVSVGDRFILREVSRQFTIGGGTFLDLRAPERKRRTLERLSRLRASEIKDPTLSLRELLQWPPFIVRLREFAVDRAIDLNRLLGQLAGIEAVVMKGDNEHFLISRRHFSDFREAIAKTLQAFHEINPVSLGMPTHMLQLRAQPNLTKETFRALIDALVRENHVVFDGGTIRLVTHRVSLTPAEYELWRRIEDLLRGKNRFQPPRVRDIAIQVDEPETNIRKFMRMLARAGVIKEVATDRFFHCSVLTEIAAVILGIVAANANVAFTVAELRDRLQNGRKVTMEILAYFDRSGATTRRGESRIVNAARMKSWTEKNDVSASILELGREASPVGRPDFKSGRGRQTVSGGFDSHSLPPSSENGKF